MTPTDTAPKQHPVHRRWPAVLWLVFVTAVTLLVYKDLPHARFFLDDYLHLHLIQKLGNPLVPFFTDIFMGAFFRPAVTIFWAMDYALFGNDASGYYVMNLVYLLLLSALLYGTIKNMTGSTLHSGLTALFFVLTPVTGVGVHWLSNRFDLLGTLFFLASLLLFLRYARFRRGGDYALSLLLAVVAFFCKEITITLPAIMVLAAAFMFWHRAPRHFNGRLIKRLLSWSTPFFTAAAVFMIWRFAVIRSLGGYVGETKEALTLGYGLFLMRSFGEYVWLMRSPLIAAVLLIIVAFLLAKTNFYSRNRLFLFGLAFAIITAAPLLMVLKYRAVMGYMTPRFFFLPNVGIAICLAALYESGAGRLRRVVAGVVLVLIALTLGLNTYVLNHKWYRDKNKAADRVAQVGDAVKNEVFEPGQRALVYACLPGLDVALDTGVKLAHPEFIDQFFVLNCFGATQTIASKDLYRAKRRLLNFPPTFTRNPCTYDDIIYGVLESEPQKMLDQLRAQGQVYVIDLDKDGNMVLLEREDVLQMINARFGVNVSDGIDPNA